MQRALLTATFAPLVCLACSNGEPSIATTPHVAVTPSRVTLSGTVTEATSFTRQAGASVCVLDAAPPACADTDADGFFTLVADDSGELALDVEASGSVRTITPVSSRSGDAFVSVTTFVTSALEGVHAATGFPADPAKGQILVLKSTAGAVAALDSGDTAYYFAAGGVPQPNATATVGAGTVAFLNVEPGTHELSFTTTATCEMPLWEGSDPDSGRLPSVAGAATIIGRFFCE